MSTSIACVSGKGGVGKTTTTCNLAAALADRGARVLAVDMDPQSNLTAALGVNPYQVERSIIDVVHGRGTVGEVVRATAVPRLDLVPSAPRREAAPHAEGSMMVLRDAVQEVASHYDFVLYDTPPTFGFETYSVIAATRWVLVPVQMSGFAIPGIKEVLRAVQEARRRLNPAVEVLGLLLCFVNLTTTFSRELVEELRGVPGVRVFSTMIRVNQRLLETAMVGQPISIYAPRSVAAAAYRSLAGEVVASV